MAPLTHLSRKSSCNFGCIVICTAFLVSSCGDSANHNRDPNLDTIVPVLSTNNGTRIPSGVKPGLAVKQGESASLLVDIAEVLIDESGDEFASDGLSADITVAGYNIDMSEAEAKIDITVNPCASGVGTESCQEWLIVPSLDAIPGRYEISIEPAGSDTLVNVRSEILFLNVDPNIALKSAPAAVAVYGDNSNGVFSVRTRDNQRWAWGDNTSPIWDEAGYVGVGYYLAEPAVNQNSVQPSYVTIAALDAEAGVNFIDLAVQSFSPSLGLSESGEVWSWGGKDQGLGIFRDENQPPIYSPAFVPGFSNVSQVDVASYPVTTYTPTPTMVRNGFVYTDGSPAEFEVRTIDAQSFALIDGEIHYWGYLTGYAHSVLEPLSGVVLSQINDETPQVLTGVAQVEAGGGHALALKNDGTVWSWGAGSYGELGFETISNADYQEDDQFSTVARQIPSLADITQIFIGGNVAMAIDTTGTTYFWGRDDTGQIGLEPQTGSISPQFTVSPRVIEGWGGDTFGEKQAIDIAPYDYGSGAIIAEANSGFPDNGNQVWVWADDPYDHMDGINRVAGLRAFDVDSGHAIDLACGVISTPDGSTSESGFVWDISKYPENPPILLPIFGKNDPLCPNRLFVSTVGQGTVSVSPEGTEVQPRDCELGICQASYDYETTTSVQLTATPADGWALDPSNTWSGSDECSEASTSSSLSVTVQGGTQCIARFIDESSLFDLSIVVIGSGRVTDNSGQIDCLGECIGSFPSGSSSVLTPEADNGWEFSGWSGDSSCGSQVIMTADTTCTAEFTEANIGNGDTTLTLTILGGPGAGQVRSTDALIPTMDCINSATPETICTAIFASNSVVELIPEPFGSGEIDVQWTGCDTDIGIEGCTLTMNGDRSVTATFVSGSSGNNPPQIILSILPNAGVTTQTVVTFDASASIDMDGTIDPVSGYLWDFDNNGIVDATGATTTHIYPAEGEYIVTLEVIDDDGASTIETNRIVRVESAP